MPRSSAAQAFRALLFVPLALLACARAGEEAEPPAPPAAEDAQDADEQPSPEERARVEARVAELVKQLANDEWAKREEASLELSRIGPLAVPQLEEAAKSEDAEVSSRAADALGRIRATMLRKRKIDPNGTDGYQPVSEGIVQVQTFEAPADRIDEVKIRAARTLQAPQDDLVVALRQAGKEDGEPLASATLDKNAVSRFYHWFSLELKADKLEKGKRYELVFSSKTSKDFPWLINSFYRDAYPGGEHREIRNGKPARELRKCDMVFEVAGGEAKATSVPKDVDLSRKDQHFGIGPDGTDLQPVEKGGAL